MPVIEHNDERFELSHSEEQKLNEFQMITSFPTEELPNVIKLLRNHSWQLEHALGRYFDGNWKENLDYEPPTHPPVSEEPEPVANNLPASNSEQAINSAFITRPEGLLPRLPVIHRLPFNYKEKLHVVGINSQPGVTNLYSGNTALMTVLFLPNLIVKIAFHLFSWLGFLISYALGLHLTTANSHRIYEIPSKPDLDRKPKDSLHDIKEIGGDSANAFLPLCSEAPYNTIFDECESKYKFMLLILIGPINGEDDEVDTNSKAFVEKILLNPSTVELLKQYSDKMNIYIRTVNDPECWALSKQLKLKYSLECLLVANVMNSWNSTLSSQKMSIISRLKVKSLQRFQNSLKTAVQRYSPELIVSATEKKELEIARKIKEMQDDAYQESLKRDAEKQLKREREEEEERLKLMMEAQKQEMIALKKIHYGLCMLLTCLEVYESKGQNSTENVSNIQFRTSDGKRIVKAFKSSDTLRDVYTQIAAHLYLDLSADSTSVIEKVLYKLNELCDDIRETKSSQKSKILQSSDDLESLSEAQLKELIQEDFKNFGLLVDNADITFDFELVSPFPRSQIADDPIIQLAEKPELWPNGSLLVETLVDEMSSEEDDDDEDSSNVNSDYEEDDCES